MNKKKEGKEEEILYLPSPKIPILTLQKREVGRPTLFSQELADKICEKLATGISLRTACKAEDMPCIATIFNWFRNHKDFLEQYTRAKEESADAMAEEMLDIADDGSNDFMVIVKGNNEYVVENKEVTNRSRLRVDTRKWLMSKMKPKKYAEKLDLTSGGEVIKGNTIMFNKFTLNETNSK